MTEIILTLESTVDNLDVDMKPLMREIFLSTPNLNKEARMELRKSATITPLRQTLPKHTAHYRSTSCRESLSLMMRRSGLTSPIMDSKGIGWHDCVGWHTAASVHIVVFLTQCKGSFVLLVPVIGLFFSVSSISFCQRAFLSERKSCFSFSALHSIF